MDTRNDSLLTIIAAQINRSVSDECRQEHVYQSKHVSAVLHAT